MEIPLKNYELNFREAKGGNDGETVFTVKHASRFPFSCGHGSGTERGSEDPIA
jgi:hypothetical protein